MKKMISIVGVVFLAVLFSCGCERNKADHSRNENETTEAPTVKVDQYSDYSFDIEDDNAYPCLYLDQEKNIVDFTGVESAEVLYIDYSTIAYQFSVVSDSEKLEKLRTVIQGDTFNHCENLKLLIIDDEWRENYLIDEIQDEIKGIKKRDIVVCCYQESQLWEQLSDQCAKLSNVILPEHLEYIGENAFAGTKIRKITIPKSVKTIGKWAFSCAYLSDVTLSKGLEYIGYGAFQGTKIRTVKVPKSVKKIEADAFDLDVKLVR